MRWHTDSRTCSHMNDDACKFCGGVDLHYTGQCYHQWLDRPESDTRECLICGTEVAG